MSKQLNGILPPITTPFNGDSKIAFDKLVFNLSLYNKFDLKGYVVFGSNGESVFLTREEKIRMIESVREHAPQNKVLIAGTGSESIKETIFLSNEAAKRGADFSLIITPSFFKNEMNHKALISYYTAIADAILIPLIIYNVTKFTNVNIDVETIAELSDHKNIAGIKNSTEDVDVLEKIINTVPKDFSVLAGTGSVLLPALKLGCIGGVLALANIAPKECLEIFQQFQDGKIDEASKIQDKMLPVNKAITASFGVAGLKLAMDLLGYYGGNPRLPLQPLDELNKSELKNILIQANLLS